ncbi:MAG: HAD family hydrolase [Candidatus Aminicenantes bacterium]|nr:HAD family hydrolase [Candidatus Aminicenantes bacterium]
MNAKKKAVFLDRDGNINKDVGYPSSYEMIDIYPYSFEAVKKINAAGLLAVVITNQSGIARGLIEEKALIEMHRKLQKDFSRRNAYFDGIYYCPHFPEADHPAYGIKCNCRKPAPGMALQAAADLNIDTSLSYMIGDKVEDILFGINIQAKTVLVLTGYGKRTQELLKEKGIKPSYVAANLLEAVNWILSQEKKGFQENSQ